jgi:hypothetical protein
VIQTRYVVRRVVLVQCPFFHAIAFDVKTHKILIFYVFSCSRYTIFHNFNMISTDNSYIEANN